MMNKQKILLVLKTPPPYGGGEKRAAWLRDYVNCNKQFRVLEYNSAKQTRANQGYFTFNKLMEGLVLWLRLIRSLIIFRPKLVYKNFAHGGFPFIRDGFCVLICRLFGARFACELAGEYFSLLDGGFLARWYAKTTLKSMKSIRVLGSSIKKKLNSEGIANCFVMDNGVEVPEERNLRKIVDGETVKFLFVGLHSPSKGFDCLINAVADLNENDCNFELHTIGQWFNNGFEVEMNQVVKRHPEMQKNVHFHGLQSGQSKWDIFDSCHVLVLPSLTEGQPLSILEALAFGMPIIASDVGGIPDVIKYKKNGFIIPVGQVVELTKKIEIFLNRPQIINEISEDNFQLFKSRFTKDNYLKETQKWLEEVSR